MKISNLPKLFVLIVLTACSAKVESPTSPAVPTDPEVASCSTTTTYPSPVNVTGTATFFKRKIQVTSVGSAVTKMNLQNPTATPLTIKYAEVRVLNSSGVIVQCGKTNSTGQIKALDGISTLQIPNSAGNYTVQVLSRSNHAVTVPGAKPAFQFYASVKSDLLTNDVYSIEQTLTSTGAGSINANLVAYARESQSSEILGGAFNIYNDLAVAYDYLAQNTSTYDLSCLSTKLDVYWKAGFNPAQYVYPDEDPSTLGTLSFYDRSEQDLFINGGQLGNVSVADTDHFDDVVILHEFGHHLETVCAAADSPGGIHYGLYRIDPRLAWSEGWGYFIGTHIVKNNIALINPEAETALSTLGGWVYNLDTMGYSDTTTGTTSGDEYIRINLSKPGNNPEQIDLTGGGDIRYYDKVDSSAAPGEGHFRETSIARSLFKTTNVCSTCTGVSYFSQMWQAFGKNSTSGLGHSSFAFRSSARFYNRLNQMFGGTMPAAIDSILNTDEAQQRETNAAFTSGGFRVHVPYGIKLTPGLTCNLKIQPRQDSDLNTDGNSDQRYSNHFYYVDLAALPGVTEIRLNATFVAGTTVDIDAILYVDGYNFAEDCNYNSSGICVSGAKAVSTDMIRYDRTAGNGTKTIANLNGLSASQKYLLNIHAYTNFQTVLSSTEYSYTLTDQNGSALCPASTY